jgi:DNA-binding response OmpR family regulator
MDMAGDARTVKEHISRIRSKLGKESGLLIISERKKGYCLQYSDPCM